LSKVIQRLDTAWVAQRIHVQIGASDWSRIEVSYGFSIPNPVREEIQSLTNKFLEFAAFELAAAPVIDAVQRTRALEKAARVLLQELCSERASDAVLAADRTIERQLRLLRADSTHSLERVADMASFVIAASGKASRELDERKLGGLQIGEHWRLWVSRIRTCLKEHGLPAGVRKDRHGNKDWMVSASVSLIKALQDCIPPEYRYWANSDEALSAAISKACREMRPPAASAVAEKSGTKRPRGSVKLSRQ
jgi:hypothetical protein